MTEPACQADELDTETGFGQPARSPRETAWWRASRSIGRWASGASSGETVCSVMSCEAADDATVALGVAASGRFLTVGGGGRKICVHER